jgi:hypothetical protein
LSLGVFVSDDSKVFDLLFAVRRSIRYHGRRAAWFDDLHRVTNVMAILISGVVLVEIGGGTVPGFIAVVAVVCAILAAFDMVLGYARQANAHRGLRDRFCELESKIISAGSADSLPTWLVERSQIERDEPAPYRALDLLCHNETARSIGCTDPNDFTSITLWQRITCHLWRWSNIMDNQK